MQNEAIIERPNHGQPPNNTFWAIIEGPNEGQPDFVHDILPTFSLALSLIMTLVVTFGLAQAGLIPPISFFLALGADLGIMIIYMGEGREMAESWAKWADPENGQVDNKNDEAELQEIVIC